MFLLESVRVNLDAVPPSRLIVGSDRVVVLEPLLIVMFPVVLFPMVRVCAFVVPSIPFPVRVVALSPLEAEIEAVGVPPAMLRTANLADEVEVPPIAKSYVEFEGDNRF